MWWSGHIGFFFPFGSSFPETMRTIKVADLRTFAGGKYFSDAFLRCLSPEIAILFFSKNISMRLRAGFALSPLWIVSRKSLAVALFELAWRGFTCVKKTGVMRENSEDERRTSLEVSMRERWDRQPTSVQKKNRPTTHIIMPVPCERWERVTNYGFMFACALPESLFCPKIYLSNDLFNKISDWCVRARLTVALKSLSCPRGDETGRGGRGGGGRRERRNHVWKSLRKTGEDQLGAKFRERASKVAVCNPERSSRDRGKTWNSTEMSNQALGWELLLVAFSLVVLAGTLAVCAVFLSVAPNDWGNSTLNRRVNGKAGIQFSFSHLLARSRALARWIMASFAY